MIFLFVSYLSILVSLSCFFFLSTFPFFLNFYLLDFPTFKDSLLSLSTHIIYVCVWSYFSLFSLTHILPSFRCIFLLTFLLVIAFVSFFYYFFSFTLCLSLSLSNSFSSIFSPSLLCLTCFLCYACFGLPSNWLGITLTPNQAQQTKRDASTMCKKSHKTITSPLAGIPTPFQA